MPLLHRPSASLQVRDLALMLSSRTCYNGIFSLLYRDLAVHHVMRLTWSNSFQSEASSATEDLCCIHNNSLKVPRWGVQPPPLLVGPWVHYLCIFLSLNTFSKVPVWDWYRINPKRCPSLCSTFRHSFIEFIRKKSEFLSELHLKWFTGIQRQTW